MPIKEIENIDCTAWRYGNASKGIAFETLTARSAAF